MKIGKHSGNLLTATGVLHIIVMLFLHGSTYAAMFRDGLWDTVGEDFSRDDAVWTFMVGIALIMWGETLQRYQNKTSQPAPVFIGYGMLAFSIVGCIVMPVSGFWLFIPQALIILVANKRNRLPYS